MKTFNFKKAQKKEPAKFSLEWLKEKYPNEKFFVAQTNEQGEKIGLIYHGNDFLSMSKVVEKQVNNSIVIIINRNT